MGRAARFAPGRPWYREPWPWIIIGLLGSVITASLITVWIAATNPDVLVVDDAEYRELRGALRAQDPEEAEPAVDPETDRD
jgi:hypothetical protein